MTRLLFFFRFFSLLFLATLNPIFVWSQQTMQESMPETQKSIPETQDAASKPAESQPTFKPSIDFVQTVAQGALIDPQAITNSKDGSGAVYWAGTFSGVLVCGETELKAVDTQIFLMKIDQAGVPLWCKSFEMEKGGSIRVMADQNGKIVLGGTFDGKLRFGDQELVAKDPTRKERPTYAVQEQAFFFAEFDALGNPVSSQSFSGVYSIRSMVIDDEGNRSVLGTFFEKIRFGDFELDATQHVDRIGVFVAGFDRSGKVLWVQKSRQKGWGNNQRLHVAPNGKLIWIGGTKYAQSGASTFVVVEVSKLDSSGKIEWTKDFKLFESAGGFEQLRGVVVDAAGAIYLAGNKFIKCESCQCEGIKTPKKNVFFAKIDSNGNLVWNKSFGNAGDYPGIYGLWLDSKQNVILAGPDPIAVGGNIVNPPPFPKHVTENEYRVRADLFEQEKRALEESLAGRLWMVAFSLNGEAVSANWAPFSSWPPRYLFASDLDSKDRIQSVFLPESPYGRQNNLTNPVLWKAGIDKKNHFIQSVFVQKLERK